MADESLARLDPEWLGLEWEDSCMLYGGLDDEKTPSLFFSWKEPWQCQVVVILGTVHHTSLGLGLAV